MKPLKGKRILDLTNVLAGPFCTYQLANLGAEVIKLETPIKGDLARNLGANPELNSKGMGISFLAQNSGKKSITLNLKSKKGKSIFRKLVRECDALVENFRPGVMTITGDSENNPFRVGYPISDTIGGLTAAMAVSAALNNPEGGSFIDISMLEATLVTMGWVVSNYLIGGVIPKAQGNENFTSAPSGSFQAKDGILNIAANKDEQWELLARHLGREDLIDNPDFSNREKRKKNRFRLKAELETVLTTRPAEKWIEELNQKSVPAGPVLTIPEILNHPQITKRGLLENLENIPGLEKNIDVLKTAALFDGKHLTVEGNPPLLGEDNNKIYNSLGLNDAAINKLKEEGVI
ncbi:CoA transferase [Hyphomicrobiales bacterium]|nr:CoA transferase [Hyphomicrobiales bacterium]